MSIFQLPPSRCRCKEVLISWFLPPNNLGGKKSVKFFWKCKFRVYNAVSSLLTLGIGVRNRVTRYNWHVIKPHAVSICHFSQKAKNQLHARCHKVSYELWICLVSVTRVMCLFTITIVFSNGDISDQSCSVLSAFSALKTLYSSSSTAAITLLLSQ